MSKEGYISQKIETEILSNFEDTTCIIDYLNDLKKCANSVGKEIIFTTGKTDGTAGTDVYRHSIKIEFNCKMVTSNNISDVFLHELGELEYIIRGFYKIRDLHDRGNITGRLTELLSHKFIALRLQELEFDSHIISSRGEGYLDISQEEPRPIENVLNIAWVFISFPWLYERKNEFELYNKYKDNVDTLISIIHDSNIFNNRNSNEEACDKIIRFLEDLGLQPLTKVILLNDY
jgi:hypothetical protein